MIDFETERQNVGPGWQPMIEMLHTRLLELDPDYAIGQIKEKFGGLRYYVDFSDGYAVNTPMAQQLVTFVEELSEKVCEVCGAAGQNRSVRGWLRTVCDPHHRARLNRCPSSPDGLHNRVNAQDGDGESMGYTICGFCGARR